MHIKYLATSYCVHSREKGMYPATTINFCRLERVFCERTLRRWRLARQVFEANVVRQSKTDAARDHLGRPLTKKKGRSKKLARCMVTSETMAKFGENLGHILDEADFPCKAWARLL